MLKLNKDSKWVLMLFILLTSSLAAVGQVIFKYAFSNPDLLVVLIALGLLLYIISTVYYLFVLSKVHLSWLYALGGLSYILTVVLAYFLLGEAVPILRWAGVATIFLGVVLVGLS